MQQNIDLSQYSTMRLGGRAAYLTEVTSRKEIEAAIVWAIEHKTPPLMIGGGSNIFWRDEGFSGLVIVNKIMGYQDFAEDEINHYLTVGAGENWDSVVERSVLAGLSGIETLSLIPGTAGATPIQNVGAYGQEIAEILVSIEAFDLHTRTFLTIPASDCGFGYRTSKFKTTDRDRYLISGITLHLMKQNPSPPFYRGVTDYLTAQNITTYSPIILRQAVIDIRTSKLPDPAVVANNGSFFANPIVDDGLLTELQAAYPDIPHWSTGKGMTKIPAAWLIEQAGFKDIHDLDTGMATWAAQPLVIVNEHARSTADLLRFTQKIVTAIQQKFQITLDQEPELLP